MPEMCRIDSQRQGSISARLNLRFDPFLGLTPFSDLRTQSEPIIARIEVGGSAEIEVISFKAQGDNADEVGETVHERLGALKHIGSGRPHGPRNADIITLALERGDSENRTSIVRIGANQK